MLTEEQAKTKWCPFVRQGSAVSGLGSLNREHEHGHTYGGLNCIASDCMAWCWHSLDVHAPEDLRTGFCGLARRPE